MKRPTGHRQGTVTPGARPRGRIAVARALAFLQAILSAIGGVALLAIGTTGTAGWTLAGTVLLGAGALWTWAGFAIGGRGATMPLSTVMLATATLLATLGAAAVGGVAAVPAAALPAATLYCLVTAMLATPATGRPASPPGDLVAGTLVRLEKQQGSIRGADLPLAQRVPKAPLGYYPPPVGEPVYPPGGRTPPPATAPSPGPPAGA